MSNATSEGQPIKLRVGVSTSRDIEDMKRALAEWLTGEIPEATAAEVVSLERPKTGGASSETYLVGFDVRYGNQVETREYVLRFQPNEHRLFLRENFDEQYRLITFLGAETDVPVPAIPFYEPDPSVLGQSFWLMERVDGLVPPDIPPYNSAGFVFDATIDQQRQLWLSGLEAAAKLAKVDVARMPRIVDLQPGENGLDENLRHWTEAMEWACQSKPTPLLLRAADWLWANKPATKETSLSWGDCRIGNMIFRNFECVALIDWETITLAGPLLDLAHWLVMDEVYTAGIGLQRLPGFGGRDEIIRHWEDFTGLSADQVAWHEVMTSFRLTIITERGMTLQAPEVRAGLLFEDGETMMSQQLRRALGRVADFAEP